MVKTKHVWQIKVRKLGPHSKILMVEWKGLFIILILKDIYGKCPSCTEKTT